MDAKQAKRRAESNRRKIEFREQEINRASVQEKARQAMGLVTTLLKSATKTIEKAVQGGRTETVFSQSHTDVIHVALEEVARLLTGKGYRVELKDEETDMGDSAAPCRTEFCELYIRWD